ncbi:hypothetical protein PHLCEN_2v6278 [Hermanssonia centrifuga]|uniref:Uncharacterized protein n=1 Tax=Hermanssonia centrifuga TaxID=98765 RepID=A0A2R6NZW8_9APHY|nr:hypothetical protein PHLCEN_2v6278 [Hermanssonia centrifuga]
MRRKMDNRGRLLAQDDSSITFARECLTLLRSESEAAIKGYIEGIPTFGRRPTFRYEDLVNTLKACIPED